MSTEGAEVQAMHGVTTPTTIREKPSDSAALVSPATTTTPTDGRGSSPITPNPGADSPGGYPSYPLDNTPGAPLSAETTLKTDKASIDPPDTAGVVPQGPTLPQVDAAAGGGATVPQAPSPEVEAAIRKINPSTAPPVEVKLFVGRVPRTFDDAQLRPLFQEYGTVGDVIIIRDRTLGAHKGCAFVRMKSITEADRAVRSLNNQKTLDSSLGPLQVKYAQGEPERLGMPVETVQPGQDQAKLFVGSLPKCTTQEDIHAVFSKFGRVDEVFLMKDDAGNSKGCAFVKFTLKEESFHAIANLNGKFTMPNGSRAVEVRFAESKKSSTPTDRQTSGAHGWQEYFTHDGRPYYHNQARDKTQWERPSEYFDFSHSNHIHNVAPNAVGAQTHGPPGANVFIFHIPGGWTEDDLIRNFAQYGQIVSARIATDRGSQRNRGFGFVSYSDAGASLAAVEALNGYNVQGKRLKVQIKKGEEQYADNHRVQYQQGQHASGLGVGLQNTNQHGVNIHNPGHNQAQNQAIFGVPLNGSGGLQQPGVGHHGHGGLSIHGVPGGGGLIGGGLQQANVSPQLGGSYGVGSHPGMSQGVAGSSPAVNDSNMLT
eukprot:Selendium_serpulae@DN5795_c1_g1_i2.p1